MSVQRDQRRQDHLEWLYQRAGRTNGLYTGLFLQRGEELARAEAEAFGQPEPAGQIPPDYIDPQHTGADRELLQAFYAACQSEGGTVDEVTLRGLRAAIAADLLAQRYPQPVPVSERLPGPEDCDDQKRCWWVVLHQSWPCLYLMKADSGLAAAVATHWLPAHALPLPGEVEG